MTPEIFQNLVTQIDALIVLLHKAHFRLSKQGEEDEREGYLEAQLSVVKQFESTVKLARVRLSQALASDDAITDNKLAISQALQFFAATTGKLDDCSYEWSAFARDVDDMINVIHEAVLKIEGKQ